MRRFALLSALLFAACRSGPQAADRPKPVDVFALSEQDFAQEVAADLQLLRVWGDGLARIERRLAEIDYLFKQKEDVAYLPEQKEDLLSTWGVLYSYTSAVEGLRRKYWNFVKHLPVDGRPHSSGYLVTHTALVIELAHGLAFADAAAGHRQLEVLLDDASPEYGIPARSFAKLKEKVIHVSTTTQLLTGDGWLERVKPALDRHGLAATEDGAWALAEMKARSAQARDRLQQRGVQLYAGNAVDIVKDGVLRAFFPVQKNVAWFMGHTRVHRVGKPLVRMEQALELAAKMEPGDVVVTRQNWFLSNIGLPGFWPHAELYVGRPDQLSAYFDQDEGVKEWLAKQPEGAATFAEYLKIKHPRKWETYVDGKDFQGHGPIRIIEAIGEGVSFTALEHAFGVDYLAVMRPRLRKVEKAVAIARAWEYQGRPYDFDFDFSSDSKLVCTEVVWKGYAPVEGMTGINVPLVKVAGRLTLPANEIVRRFDAEYDTPNRQLDFVAFLDGLEAQDVATPTNVETFRSSWKRVKWDVAQE